MVMVRVAYRATGVVFRQRTRTWPAGSAASSGRVLVATVQAIAVPLAEMSPKATLPPADEAKAQVGVEVYKGGEKLVDTTVSVNRGSTFMVGGPRHDGGILLLPITANY